MMENIVIVTATSEKDDQESILYKSLFDGQVCKPVFKNLGYRSQVNNKEHLAKVYNHYLDTIKDAKYIIFCHDDISIEDSKLYEKIDKAIGDDSPYTICGVAGNTQARIQEKNLWHLMGNKDSMSGAVAHYTGKDATKCFMTNFGVTPQRCILLDGIFLAVNVDKINEVGLRFDENYPTGFHFYDIDFCLEANKKGLKMTTWPIWIVHMSHGLTDINNEDWNKNNEYFKNKWINKL